MEKGKRFNWYTRIYFVPKNTGITKKTVIKSTFYVPPLIRFAPTKSKDSLRYLPACSSAGGQIKEIALFFCHGTIKFSTGSHHCVMLYPFPEYIHSVLVITCYWDFMLCYCLYIIAPQIKHSISYDLLCHIKSFFSHLALTDCDAENLAIQSSFISSGKKRGLVNYKMSHSHQRTQIAVKEYIKYTRY